MILISKGERRNVCLWFVFAACSLFTVLPAYANTPSAGGNTTVVNPTGETAVSINEDAVQPETPNIRLVVPTLIDAGGGTPSAIRILSVSGGTLWQSDGSTITLGAAGTSLSLSSSRLDLRFRPDAGRDINASFQYVVVDPHNSGVNSAASTATISITAVNDAPVLQTLSGNTGIGLAATYYISSWDLTGPTYQRIDSTINFSNNFAVPGENDENFSVRWSGQVKAPVTGNVIFSTQSDDGVRLWINDVLIIDNWTLHGTTTDTASAVSLTAGEKYPIRMEFYERGGGEVAVLQWSYTGQSTQVVPQENLFPATTRPTLSYVNGATSAIVDDAITVADVDSVKIMSGTVVISDNYQSGEDSLLFTDQNGITGSYSAGTLRLTGSASLATYQAALRTVRYANSNSDPDTSTRTVTFVVSDGLNNSNNTYRTIGFTGTNTAPVITEGTSTSVTMDEDSTPTAFALTLNATDAEYQSITWTISSAASHGTASTSGDGDSNAILYTPAADYFGSDSFVVQASDGTGGTDTITVNVTITDRTLPVISAVTSTSVTASGATITWTTNENTSTKVAYGLTSSYGSNTTETDTSSRVTVHTKVMSGLLSCTTYHYQVISKDTALNSATSSDKTFTTGGCAGNAMVSTATGTSVIANANGSTGSIALSDHSVSITVPAGYVATNTTCPTGAQFQLKSLEPEPVKDELGSPSDRVTIVSAQNLSAYCPDSTRVTSFDQPISITFTYDDADIVGLNEASLGVYHYGSLSTEWEELTCSQDLSANTLTCTTTSFSSFGLFGTPVSSASNTEGSTSITRSGGCRGSNCKSVTQKKIVTAHPAATRGGCSAETIPSKNEKLWMSINTQSVSFEDVPVHEWFACPVFDVITKNIFSGYKDEKGNLTGRYGPADTITIGQLAKVATMLGEVEVTGTTTGKNWANAYMNAAKAMKYSVFLQSVDAATPATRGAVIQTILEALAIPITEGSLPYSDVSKDSTYAKAISTATRMNIVSGDGKGLFRPTDPVNRAEVAKMIVASLQYKQ